MTVGETRTVGGDKRAALRRRLRRRAGVAAKRGALLGFGVVLLVAGIAAVPTPVPGLGLALMAAAIYFLVRGSRYTRQAVKWSRRRVPPFSRGLERIKTTLPPGMRHVIDRSAPGE
jgi:hypothetical protein